MQPLREQALAQEVWPSFPEVPRIRKPACLSGGQRAAEPDSSPRFWLGFCPGPTAFLWVWRGWRHPGRVIFCPEVPRCPGWKGNWAVGLNPKATTHFSSLGGPYLEWNSVWVAPGARPNMGGILCLAWAAEAKEGQTWTIGRPRVRVMGAHGAETLLRSPVRTSLGSGSIYPLELKPAVSGLCMSPLTYPSTSVNFSDVPTPSPPNPGRPLEPWNKIFGGGTATGGGTPF